MLYLSLDTVQRTHECSVICSRQVCMMAPPQVDIIVACFAGHYFGPHSQQQVVLGGLRHSLGDLCFNRCQSDCGPWCCHHHCLLELSAGPEKKSVIALADVRLKAQTPIQIKDVSRMSHAQ